ncbi:uncharacterized protein ASPGLDRAFT_822309 [Aspergillus glaucus CBS 516.65]|uniref:Uncharacterized protein n=1 Tax=Aspergillus glaucus CBS 516.65 TaxID=1160497 RepID=A0A1L9V9Y7_ASPGL|nr:hypothetical protein ASPGLDRAFT_822309 [Aspergillus glaucus CBS 516.65]OJJ80695.1 hypothetical protein ASPGLDRAFT_822309 [Aspergillus glaucus CBS 516.65]
MRNMRVRLRWFRYLDLLWPSGRTRKFYQLSENCTRTTTSWPPGSRREALKWLDHAASACTELAHSPRTSLLSSIERCLRSESLARCLFNGDRVKVVISRVYWPLQHQNNKSGRDNVRASLIDTANTADVAITKLPSRWLKATRGAMIARFIHTASLQDMP